MKPFTLCLSLLVGLSSVCVAQSDDDIIEEEGYTVLRGTLRKDNDKVVFTSYDCATPGDFTISDDGDKKAGKILKKMNKKLDAWGDDMESITLKGKVYLSDNKIVPKNWSMQLPQPECVDGAPAHCIYFNAIYELYIRNIEITRKMAFFSVISSEEFDEELGENVSVVRCYDADCEEVDCQEGKAKAKEMWTSIDKEMDEIEILRTHIVDVLEPVLADEKENLPGLTKAALTVQSVQATRMQAKNVAEIPKMLRARKESKEAMKMVQD